MPTTTAHAKVEPKNMTFSTNSDLSTQLTVTAAHDTPSGTAITSVAR